MAADLVILARDSLGPHVSGAADAPSPVFSITKMFIAVAALRMAESSALDLDAEAAAHLPELPRLPAGATVRQLLGHTAGLSDYATTPGYQAVVAASPAKPWTLAEILAGTPPASHPTAGTQTPCAFRYSNTGYWLLGALLERIAGMPLASVLKHLVFDHCELGATRYPEPESGITADGYDTRWAGPAGAAWSTATDLDRFLAALFDGTLLSAGSLAAMMTTVPVPAYPPWRRPGYGLGLMIDDALGVAGHGGSGPGHQAAAFTCPASGRSAVVLARSPAEVDPVELALELAGGDQSGARGRSDIS